MMNQKQQMLTEPIKRFLIQLVAKAGSRAERMPSELELCERFSVCRPTAHKAVEELVEYGYLQHLPNKRGGFSNPDYAQTVSFSIGVVSSLANCSHFGYPQSRILGSFLSHLGDLNAITSFLTLNKDPELAAEEILNGGLDAIFWNCPDANYFPVIEKLIENNIAVIMIGSYFNFQMMTPKSNFLSNDFFYQGECRAEFFLRRKAKNLLYCGNPGPTFEGFKSRLQEHGIIFDDAHILDDEEPMTTLETLLEKETFDGLICDGNKNQHNHVLKTLTKLGSRIPVLLSYGLDLEYLQKEYPNLQLFSIMPKMDLKQLTEMGVSAADHVREMLLSKKNYRFQNELFRHDFHLES